MMKIYKNSQVELSANILCVKIW